MTPGESEAEGESQIRWYAPMTARELMLAWGSLWLAGLLIFLPYLLHGGLFSDDWATAAGTLYPPEGSGLIGAFTEMNNLLSSCRPVLILFIPFKHFLFGTDAFGLVALSIGLALLVAALAYAILRTLNVPWYHAWLISALTIAYPWFDSTRFWESANPLSLSLVFAFAGLWLALIGLSRNSWRLHLGAAFLYLLSILTYEITLPFIVAAGLLYTVRNGWRAARLRWAVDLLVVGAAGYWDRVHTPRSVTTLSDTLSQLTDLTRRSGEMLARTLFPIGTEAHTSTMLGIVATIFAIALVIYLLFPAQRVASTGWGLRGWLLLGAAGLIVAVLGWMMMIPAGYELSTLGTANRVNGLAGFGLLLVVYAAFGIVGFAVGRLVKHGPLVGVATTLALALLLGATYVHVLERHSKLWRSSYSLQLTASDTLQATFPKLPHDTTVFAGGFPANFALGVPIFSTTWDLDGLIRVKYADNTLEAYPITEELQLECRLKGVVAVVGEEDTPLARYGSARLINLQTGRSSTPRSRRECLAQQPLYPPGPLHLNMAY